MKILVSGFGPFKDEAVNPTESLIAHINSCAAHERPDWAGLDVRGVVLPVEFTKAFDRLEEERQHFKPDVILSFGLAGGRKTIDIENLAHKDGNAGKSFEDRSTPIALSTTLPISALQEALKEKGFPVGNSFSAGSFVCNDLFYRMQERLRYTRVRSGFIHVPRLEDMPLEKLVAAFDVFMSVFSGELKR